MSKDNYNIIDVLGDLARGAVEYAEEKEQSRRLTICENCDNLNKLRQCKLCHCFMDLKVKFQLSKCDAGKW